MRIAFFRTIELAREFGRDFSMIGYVLTECVWTMIRNVRGAVGG